MTDHIHATATSHKSRAQAADKFTREQFNWLRQVAFDGDLPSSAARVAIALTKYFNRGEDGWAWMAQTTLARELGVTDRCVRKALDALVDRGHIISRRRGRMETNLYRLTLREGDRNESSDHDRNESSDHPGVTGTNMQSDRNENVKVTGTNVPPNPLIEPSEKESLSERGKSCSSGRRHSAPPPDAVTAQMRQDAQQISGWPPSRLDEEFQKFRDNHLGKGTRSSDWEATWRTWVRRGVMFDRQQRLQGWLADRPVIDQNGDPVAAPNKQQRHPLPRRQTNTERLQAGR